MSGEKIPLWRFRDYRLMARVSGPGIDQKARYQAVELWGKGIRLEKEKPAEADLDAPVGVKISRDTARKIGRHKLHGETLAQAVKRLALEGLKNRLKLGCFSGQNLKFRLSGRRLLLDRLLANKVSKITLA